MESFSNITNSSASIQTICLPIQDTIPELDQRARLLMAVIFGILMTVGIPVNSTVVYLIKSTGQYENQSTRLIMYCSIMDICGAALVNGAYFVYMLFYERIACTILLAMHTLVNISLFASLYIVAFIGFDRYMRVKYLNDYNSKLTASKFFACQMFYLFLVTTQSALSFLGIFHFGHGYALAFTAPINVLVFFFMVVGYGLSIQKLKAHQRASRALSGSQRNVVKIAALYLLVSLLIFIPAGSWQILHKAFLSTMITAELESIVLAIMYMCSTFQSIIYATIFMTVNRETKRKIRSMWRGFTRKIRRSNIVNVDDLNSSKSENT